MTVEKCYRVYCDECKGNQWDYSYTTYTKKDAIKEFEEAGWVITETKATCQDCNAKKTMICPSCKGKLKNCKDIIECENKGKGCNYWIAKERGID